MIASDTGFAEMDRHFGRFMEDLARSQQPELLAAAALASRATANGDICVRLGDFAGRVVPGLDVATPALEPWMDLLHASEVVGAPGEFRPLVLDAAGRLYLYRYWAYEQRLAQDLRARAADVEDIDAALLRAGLARYFPDARDAQQKLAAATAVLRRFCVISGGPGTGKTTTVVKILALLIEQARERPLSIAVAAPTGKAAARVQDAMRAALARIDADLLVRAAMPGAAFTIHRLLGARPDSVYYRHDAGNPLALDVLVVDEASMADLALSAKLVNALPPRARLILLGDKDQLASVEAGAVLGDVCANAGYSARFAKRLRAATGLPAASIPGGGKQTSPLADSIALLTRSYRFGTDSGIGRLARCVNAGQGAQALALLQSDAAGQLGWRSVARAELRRALGEDVAQALRPYFEAVKAHAAPQDVFERFNAFRVLCAHRTGLYGVTALNRAIEEILDELGLVSARHTWYAGRPVMITRNDYNLRLFNGDVGIALPDADAPGRTKVFFTAADGVRSVAPARLPEHETVYAMTVHKSQGSEFARVLMILPPELSPITSRELIYTGITRAMRRVDVWGDETAFREAVERRVERASGLRERLWNA